MGTNQRRAVFVDRDGVINTGGKVDRVEEFRMLPGVPQALKRLKQSGLLLVLTTNQGGLGEDLEGNVIWEQARLDRSHLAQIHAEMQRQLGPEAAFDLIKFCPHAYWDPRGDCACHKPKPGMMLQAAAELDIDLAGSWMVGDRFPDMEAAVAAGLTPLYVLTGQHDESAQCPQGTIVLPTLKEVADFILGTLIAQ